ncbi:NAD(P)H-binding protein [Streptomyces sp. SID13726]|uniref:SDR family oxidoreductase n=1 Tax=Streptomyces sp. SID13726 TaxID=2706058 RepID=UPI0013BE1F3B|nr:NAD(P)H-binding protein [Streptomyces sp. SID13726]NEB05894.1 NAD(P)H-binding protein [Streptomyces sp. SID13726]
MTTILVTGGTGTLGRIVTERLRADGHEVRVLSRRGPEYPVDLRQGGSALDAAVAGVDTIVHCASTQRGGDEEAARNLLDAARRAGVRHCVYISIVGVDRVPFGYYRSKFAVERMVEESGIGWTTLRATQFHDLLVTLFRGLARLPVVFVPAGVRDQPVEVAEVAERLAELAVGAPAGRVADMGGPEVRTLTDLARAYLRTAGKKRPVVSVRLFGKAYREFRAGGHLAVGQAVGKGTFEDYLRAGGGSSRPRGGAA